MNSSQNCQQHLVIMNGRQERYYQPYSRQQAQPMMVESTQSIHSMESPISYNSSYSIAHINDHGQYPSYEEFEDIVQDYLQNLSSKKRDKALIDQRRYSMVLQVLKDPKNTSISTAQFRFWVKKMFQLSENYIVCHDGKPVATREQIYNILVRAHRETHHGGRDKTSTLVRQRYSWIPKELIARFVRHCPFCISRRNGNQQNHMPFHGFCNPSSPIYPEDQQGNTTIASSSSCESSTGFFHSNDGSLSPEEKYQNETFKDHEIVPMNAPWQPSSYYSDMSQYQNSTHSKPSDTDITTALFEDGGNHDYYAHTSVAEQSLSYMTYTNQAHLLSPMQFPISTYYVHDDGLKSNSSYSLINTNFPLTTPPVSRTNSHTGIYYDCSADMNNPCFKSAPSPSMSLSSSSSSASSPINLKYSDGCVYQGCQHTSSSSSTHLLCHQQSLF